jgi:hypothetical protein
MKTVKWAYLARVSERLADVFVLVALAERLDVVVVRGRVVARIPPPREVVLRAVAEAGLALVLRGRQGVARLGASRMINNSSINCLTLPWAWP